MGGRDETQPIVVGGGSVLYVEAGVRVGADGVPAKLLIADVVVFGDEAQVDVEVVLRIMEEGSCQLFEVVDLGKVGNGDEGGILVMEACPHKGEVFVKSIASKTG